MSLAKNKFFVVYSAYKQNKGYYIVKRACIDESDNLINENKVLKVYIGGNYESTPPDQIVQVKSLKSSIVENTYYYAKIESGHGKNEMYKKKHKIKNIYFFRNFT